MEWDPEDPRELGQGPEAVGIRHPGPPDLAWAPPSSASSQKWLPWMEGRGSERAVGTARAPGTQDRTQNASL